MGNWLAQMDHLAKCLRCFDGRIESLKHYLWKCLRAHEVWRHALKIIIRVLPNLSWGAFAWLMIHLGSQLVFEMGGPTYYVFDSGWHVGAS